MQSENVTAGRRMNNGKPTGQKPPLKLREIWAIRTRLQMMLNVRELVMFNLAIDSKLERAISRDCGGRMSVTEDACTGGKV